MVGLRRSVYDIEHVVLGTKLSVILGTARTLEWKDPIAPSTVTFLHPDVGINLLRSIMMSISS
jgi:hypothetical protein